MNVPTKKKKGKKLFFFFKKRETKNWSLIILLIYAKENATMLLSPISSKYDIKSLIKHS